jgi:D-glycero-D-manno-heptose 1,7-bisphosphate phosphatase
LNRAILLDRDGVINEDRDDYVKSWAEVRFIKGARRALKQIHQAGVPIVVITNQAAIGRGIISESDLSDIHTRLQGAIKKSGGSILKFYYCPHHPDDQCRCRKPKSGLLKRAARDLNLNLADCFFVGDALRDVQAGRRAGCRTVLVQTGQGKKTLQKILTGQTSITPDWVCDNLASATPLMLNYFKSEIPNS